MFRACRNGLEQELEFSIMASSPAGIQPLLDEFQAKHHIHVRLRLLSWDTAWSDLLKVALYGDGPDVSEIGSTWLGDLVAMNALRAFEEDEINALGRASAFLLSAWHAARLVGQGETWAIPWVTGARLLYFRRELLEHAGLDEHNAFRTAEQLDLTCSRLRDAGITIPWTVPTGLTHTTLLNVTSWVWGAGGDFVTSDGKHTLFSHPQARAGLSAYYALSRFLTPEVSGLNGLEPDAQFLQNEQTALTISGPWLFTEAHPDVRARIGVALPPGASFVGGSHLVVWKHTAMAEAALELIQFLTQTSAQVALQSISRLASRKAGRADRTAFRDGSALADRDSGCQDRALISRHEVVGLDGGPSDDSIERTVVRGAGSAQSQLGRGDCKEAGTAGAAAGSGTGASVRAGNRETGFLIRRPLPRTPGF